MKWIDLTDFINAKTENIEDKVFELRLMVEFEWVDSNEIDMLIELMTNKELRTERYLEEVLTALEDIELSPFLLSIHLLVNCKSVCVAFLRT